MNIYALLSSLPAVTALVGKNIWPTTLPERAEFPAITFQRIGGPSFRTLAGGRDTQQRVQFDCWWRGASPEAAEAVRDALINALDGLTAVVGGQVLKNAWVIGSDDDFVQELLAYRAIAEFYLLY